LQFVAPGTGTISAYKYGPASQFIIHLLNVMLLTPIPIITCLDIVAGALQPAPKLAVKVSTPFAVPLRVRVTEFPVIGDGGGVAKFGDVTVHYIPTPL